MEIITNLFLGNEYDSIHEYKYDLVINCSKNLLFYNKTHRVRIPIDENNNQDNLDILNVNINHVIELVDNYLANNKKILIHCKNGQQCSASLVVCYLMAKNKWSANNAINYIKWKKNDAFYGKNIFYDYLKKFIFE